MYIKIFESKNSNKHYAICYKPSWERVGAGHHVIENEKKESKEIDEKELFDLIDGWFKNER